MSKTDHLLAQSLRHQIRVERLVVSRGTMGGEQRSFVLRAEMRAEVVQQTGQELEAAGRVEGLVRLEFRVRYRNDILLTDRVVWEGAAYGISALVPLGLKRSLRIFARLPAEGTGT